MQTTSHSKAIVLMLILSLACSPAKASAENPIEGETLILPEDMFSFVRARNPAFTMEIAEAYWDVAEMYGIRGDVALCQAIIETGWFKFMDGTAVLPSQFNYCGLGVTTLGEHGCSFDSLLDGVKAHFQHLLAYATKRTLPDGETLVDTRFGLVKRGSAPTWEKLSGRWAMDKHYGSKIMKLYKRMLKECGVENH